jgi:mersacidin/lichenicidin family type 2 lantibiotic
MTFSQGLGDIYERWTLDAVIQIASALSLDVPKGSARYQTLSDETRKTLSEFAVSTGRHPDWPETRKATYYGLLGRSFDAAGTGVRRGAIAIVQSGSDPSRTALLAFQDSVSIFRSFLGTIAESAVAEVDYRSKAIFGRATQVLRDQDVTNAFGLKGVAMTNWPLGNTLSGEGAFLVAELSRLLQPPYAQGISRQNFLAAQRVAHYGAQSIRQILGDTGQSDEVEQTNNVVDSVYNWSVAFQDLIPNIILGWRDPDYRRGLSIKHQELLPDHPAGEIEFPQGELTLARGAARDDLTRMRFDMTYTVFGEVCCCNSMDLCSAERSLICWC